MADSEFGGLKFQRFLICLVQPDILNVDLNGRVLTVSFYAWIIMQMFGLHYIFRNSLLNPWII